MLPDMAAGDAETLQPLFQKENIAPRLLEASQEQWSQRAYDQDDVGRSFDLGRKLESMTLKDHRSKIRPSSSAQ